MEKEYTAMKTKEQEELVELKVSSCDQFNYYLICLDFCVIRNWKELNIYTLLGWTSISFCPIQRLRTENRLLRQRIDCLEAESSALADRLIQGQVSRAEEAEHNFAIKVGHSDYFSQVVLNCRLKNSVSYESLCVGLIKTLIQVLYIS